MNAILPPALFLLAPLVLVPLALPLLERKPVRASWLLPAAALLLAGSFFLPRGLAAGLLALPWLLMTCLLALRGLQHLRAWPRTAAELAGDVGCIYLAVGGAWVVLARLGMRPLGFPDVIVQATATHFHYAGFLLPVLVGLAARTLDDLHCRVTVFAVLLGVPLTAVGITLSVFEVKWIELAAAWFMAGAGLLAAALQFRLALREISLIRQLLLLVSGLSLTFGMTLAGAYALGQFLGTPWLDIPAMIASHGALNALGFAVPGLLAHHLAKARPEEGLRLTQRSENSDNEPVVSQPC